MRKGFLSIAAILLLSSFLLMPSFNRPTDVYQGFNFKKDKQTPIGYITSLQIGGAVFNADIVVKDPSNPAATLPAVVGVLSNFNWATGQTDPMNISAQISTQNRMQAAALALQNNALSGQVKFGVVLYEYDPQAKKYYKSFTNANGLLSGSIQKTGADFNMVVASDPSNEVQSPINYALSLGLMPQSGISQTITIATSSNKMLTKPWGQ